MVNKGYKKTEIGIIPEAWELCSLEHNFDFFQNNTYARDCMNDISGMVRNIHYGDVLIKYGAILDCDKESIPFINSGISVNTVNRTIQSGDIIMADTAEDETVGKAIEVVNVGSKTIVSGLHTFFIRPHANLFAQKYLGYFINASVYHDQLLPHIVGTKVSSISKKSLNETFVIRPGLPEQRRIAEALTDIDTLIFNLEKLIAKKRAVKKGAMQELLTGRKRLPGFSGEWLEKKLGDFGGCIRGVSYNPYNDLFPFETSGATVLLRANNIDDGEVLFNNVQYVSDNVVSEAQRLINGDILIAMSSGSRIAVGKTGTFMKSKGKYCVGAFCAVFRSSFNRYIKYLFQSGMYQKQLSNLLEGTSINNLNGKLIENLKFPFAPTTKEQTAIATILSDMDSEITDLEEKLSKYRNIKIGMMQTLLTGRIRLSEQDTTVEAVAPLKVKKHQKPESKGHNQPFDDAVVIAAIVNAFYSDKYPLGRKKVQKLLYLLRRRQDACITSFKKKAAGPYADEVRYKGGEPIAKRNSYVTVINSKQGSMFVKGKDIGKALEYVAKWDMQPEIDWLTEHFLHTKVDKLELLATIDMAMCDLENSGITVSVDSVKRLIATDKEWKAKLKKTYFSDADIGWAITECLRMFNSTGR